MTALLLALPIADFDGHMDWDGDWSVVMVVAMVLFWVLVIGAIVLLLREVISSRGTRGSVGEDPLQILDRRLADGSITPDDYRERRTVLTGEGGGKAGAPRQ